MNKISVWACNSKTQGTLFLVFWTSYLLLSQCVPTKYTYVSIRAYFALNPSCSAYEPFTRIPAQIFLYVVPKVYVLVTAVYSYYQFKLKCIIK
jgi:hypothetical protein